MTLKKILLCLVVLIAGSVKGMTYDNRFFPLLDKPVMHEDNTQFFARVQPFYMFADHAYNHDGEDRALFNVFGLYNQAGMNKALKDVGEDSFTLPVKGAIPWSMLGKVDAGGLAFRWYYSITPHCDLGGSFFFAGTRSRLQFLLDLDASKITDAQRQELYNIQQQMIETDTVGDHKIKGLLWNSFGVSDLDLYARLGFMKHHFLKFRTFDLGAKFGLIIPTAKGFNLDYPSSLIFGGDEQWGCYFDAALNTELREDLFAGFNLRFIQRFKHETNMRFPIDNVPNNFGPIEEKSVRIDPGFTFVFGPYAAIDNLREGLGFQFGYTLIVHTSDDFNVPLPQHKISNLKNITKTLSDRSQWGSEYITCSATYDFAKDKECRGAMPRASLDIDIPISVVVARQSFKTYGISLRIESDLW